MGIIFGTFCSYYPWCHLRRVSTLKTPENLRWILGSAIIPVMMQSWLMGSLWGFVGTYDSRVWEIQHGITIALKKISKTQILWTISSLSKILRASCTLTYSVTSVLGEAAHSKASVGISNPMVLQRVDQTQGRFRRPRHPREEQAANMHISSCIPNLITY